MTSRIFNNTPNLDYYLYLFTQKGKKQRFTSQKPTDHFYNFHDPCNKCLEPLVSEGALRFEHSVMNTFFLKS